MSEFASYRSRNPDWGVFEETIGLADHTGHVNPDYFDRLTDEERELILIYNSMTPAERKAIAAETAKEKTNVSRK